MHQPLFLLALALANLLPWAHCQTLKPKPGIGQELAQAREAVLSQIRYELDFKLEKGMQATTGTCTIQFNYHPEAKSKAPLVLDFAGETIYIFAINEHTDVDVLHVANHLVLPPGALRSGLNTIRATFTSKVAATGTPLTVYKDKVDQQEYLYTLLVPADAHRLFPCFDQPGLKAVFALSLTAPEDWKTISNGRQVGIANGKRIFADTEPLSTYLFAFAAGPFVVIADNNPAQLGELSIATQMFLRQSKVEEMQAEEIFTMHRQSLEWLSDYFQYPYPFHKMDIVVLPGFPYGGMEHAGAIFYRESGLAFDHDPTEGELTKRSTLIYHEVSHQWFGNLVTMQWFDDLWLKEGFATFMGYTLFETLEPGKHAWLRFHQRVKPKAYQVDATAGTTPVYQKLQNLAEAKSAYGAIVYNKAPAVLRELHARLGPQNFQKGLQVFLQRHAFGNAIWQDLMHALEEAADTEASHWSNRWILSAGMPRIRAQWQAEAGKIKQFHILQEATLQQGEQQTEAWPLQLSVMLIYPDGGSQQHQVVAQEARTLVKELAGTDAPACVLLNPKDIAYGQFLLDAASRDYLLQHAMELQDPLTRAVAMAALYETLRETELAPAAFAKLALQALAKEQDVGSHAWLLGSLRTTLLRYMNQDQARPLLQEFGDILWQQLEGERGGIKLQCLRMLMTVASDSKTEKLCQQIVAGEDPVSRLKLGKRDRFKAAAALLAMGADEDILGKMAERMGKEDIGRELYIARAASNQASNKEEYYASYLQLDEPPEQWISGSLGNFHWPGQEASTLPYLRKALDQVQWVKENRKIFFMPAWINAFINGHSSKEALQIVEAFQQENPDLPLDIRRKVLQSTDSLRRAVRIQEKWQ